MAFCKYEKLFIISGALPRYQNMVANSSDHSFFFFFSRITGTAWIPVCVCRHRYFFKHITLPWCHYSKEKERKMKEREYEEEGIQTPLKDKLIREHNNSCLIPGWGIRGSEVPCLKLRVLPKYGSRELKLNFSVKHCNASVW